PNVARDVDQPEEGRELVVQILVGPALLRELQVYLELSTVAESSHAHQSTGCGISPRCHAAIRDSRVGYLRRIWEPCPALPQAGERAVGIGRGSSRFIVVVFLSGTPARRRPRSALRRFVSRFSSTVLRFESRYCSRGSLPSLRR